MDFQPASSALVAVFCLILLAVLDALIWAIQHACRLFKLAFHLPYMLIALVCVGGALFGDLLLTRALWQTPTPRA